MAGWRDAPVVAEAPAAPVPAWQNAPVVEESAPTAPPSETPLHARAAQQMGVGMLPGFDRVSAAVQAATDPVLGRSEWGDDFGTRYAEHLRANQGQSAEYRREHPVSAALNQVAGSLPTAAALGPAGATAGRAASVKEGARVGAGIGAMYGAGEARSTDPVGVLAEAGAAAAGGGLLGAGFGAAMPNMTPAPPRSVTSAAAGESPAAARTDASGFSAWLRQKAGERNLKAAGAIQSDIARSRKQLGPGGKNDGRAALTEIGAEMGEKGLVSPLSTPEKTFERSVALMDDAGNRIGAILDDADRIAGESGASPSLGRVLDDLMPTLQELKANPNPGAQEAAARFERLLGNYVDLVGKERLTFAEAHKLRRQLDGELYGMRGNKDPWADTFKQALHDVRGALTREIETSLDAATSNSAAWKAANRDYQVGAKALEFADKGMDRAVGNNQITPYEMLAALGGLSGAGGATGNLGLGGAGGALAFLGTRFARRHGSGVQGSAMLGLSNLLRTNPQAFGQYADRLAAVEAQRGPEGLAAAHYVLSVQDPAYAALMRRVQLAPSQAAAEGEE